MNFGRSSPSKHKAWLCIKLTGWSVTKLLNVSLCWQPPISPHQVQPCQKCQLESLTIHWHPCHMKAGDRRSYCHWGGAVNSHQPLWLLLPLRKDAMTRSAFGTVTGAEHGATGSIFGFSSRSLSLETGGCYSLHLPGCSGQARRCEKNLWPLTLTLHEKVKQGQQKMTSRLMKNLKWEAGKRRKSSS